MAGNFLPPDPHAPAPPAPPPPAAVPASSASAPRRRNDRAFVGLALGSGALGVLFITVGGLYPVTLPFSVAAWVLGAKAKRVTPEHPQAQVALLLGIVGTVLAFVAGGVYAIVSPVD